MVHKAWNINVSIKYNNDICIKHYGLNNEVFKETIGDFKKKKKKLSTESNHSINSNKSP